MKQSVAENSDACKYAVSRAETQNEFVESVVVLDRLIGAGAGGQVCAVVF